MYFTFLCSHAHRSPYSVHRRAKSRILNYYPRFRREDVVDYSRAKLMLHRPFRTIDELLYIPAIHDEENEHYFEAYEVCQQRCNHPRDGFDDPLPDPEPSVHDDTQEDPDEQALNNMDTEWGELARVLSDRNGNNVDVWNMLGRQPEDNVDWSDRVGSYPELAAEWWKVQNADHPVRTRNVGSVTAYEQLEVKQKLLWDTFVDHFNNVTDGPDRRQLLLHVDGKAGTGKTTVIISMCAEVDRIAGELGLGSVIARAAPTGVAACNFGGSTLHSLLRLPVKEKAY